MGRMLTHTISNLVVLVDEVHVVLLEFERVVLPQEVVDELVVLVFLYVDVVALVLDIPDTLRHHFLWNGWYLQAKSSGPWV